MNLELISQYTKEYSKEEMLRHRSWNFCYQAFGDENIPDEELALHLSVFLSNWGMYRNSNLLNNSYKVHLGAIKIIKRFSDLRKDLLRINKEQNWKLHGLLSSYYKKHSLKEYPISATDTLISKIMLGTLGSVPAFDAVWKVGVSRENELSQTFNKNGIDKLNVYIKLNQVEIKEVQSKLQEKYGITYSAAKILDMYFWQKGYLIEEKKTKVKHPDFVKRVEDDFNRNKRYKLHFFFKERDLNKEVIVIMKNPSKADKNTGDQTTQRVLNYIYNNKIQDPALKDIGKVTILNLIPIVETDSSLLKEKGQILTDSKNKKVLKYYCQKRIPVIVGWGNRPHGLYDEFQVLKKDVYLLFKQFDTKVFHVSNLTATERNPLHGLCWAYGDELYKFTEHHKLI